MNYSLAEIGEAIKNFVEFVTKTVSAYIVDFDYGTWLLWLFYPMLITFLLPFVIFFLLYGSAIFLHIYRLRHLLHDAYVRDRWRGARKALAALWDAQGTIWHGNFIYFCIYHVRAVIRATGSNIF